VTTTRLSRLTRNMAPALVLAAAVLAGCGSSSKSTSSSSSAAAAPATTPTPTATTATTPSAATGGTSASSTLSLAANPEGQLKFDKSSLSAKAGSVTIAFTNAAPLAHNLTIESSGSTVGATPTFMGGAKSLTVNLKPGTYKFYCSVPGHRQAGMEGTLTVK
jgi:plastocyanin